LWGLLETGLRHLVVVGPSVAVVERGVEHRGAEMTRPIRKKPRRSVAAIPSEP
jgi:hypothetical protein